MIDTKNKMFVECTRDKRWGADSTFRSQRLKTKKWQGENLLGSTLNKEKAQILQELETEVAREQDEQTMTPVTEAKTPPPKDLAKSKRDKKKSPKERQMERKREQRALEMAEG